MIRKIINVINILIKSAQLSVSAYIAKLNAIVSALPSRTLVMLLIIFIAKRYSLLAQNLMIGLYNENTPCSSLDMNLIKERLILFLNVYQCIHKRSYVICEGTAVAQWLRRCATNPKVAGSIPDGVIGIFH